MSLAHTSLSHDDERNALLRLLNEYTPSVDEDPTVRDRILALVRDIPDCADRTTLPAHLTASAWVIDTVQQRVLLIHHKKLAKWIQPGGHADGSLDLLSVAVREVLEETSLVVSRSNSQGVFDLDIHEIPAFGDTPAHHHFDVRFMFSVTQGCSGEHGSLQENREVFAAQWIPFAEVAILSKEESVLRMVKKSYAA